MMEPDCAGRSSDRPRLEIRLQVMRALAFSLAAALIVVSQQPVIGQVEIDKPPPDETRVASPARLTTRLGNLAGPGDFWQTRELGVISVDGVRLMPIQIWEKSDKQGVRLRLRAYATLEPGEDKDVHLRWEFMVGDEVVVDFRHSEYIGAAQGEVDWEEWELRMTREQFERVFSGKGKLRLTIEVRPEA